MQTFASYPIVKGHDLEFSLVSFGRGIAQPDLTAVAYSGRCRTWRSHAVYSGWRQNHEDLSDYVLFSRSLSRAGAAFRGAGVVSNESVVVEMPSHSAHASQQEMGASQDIMESSNSVSAEGERPLWEVAPHTKYVPLGDTARMLRKEQFAAKKATKIWEN